MNTQAANIGATMKIESNTTVFSRGLFGTRTRQVLAVAALFTGMLVGCGDGAGDNGEGAIVENAQALTVDQCSMFQSNGEVYICHQTASAQQPYKLIRTSVASCAGHQQHPGDYITSIDPSSPLYDPTCSGLGCLPDGSPYDGSVDCCEGAAPDAGYCVNVPCPENASGAPQCTCNPGFDGELTWDGTTWLGTCTAPRLPQTCAEILTADPTAPSGVYALENNGRTFQAYCNMTLDGGGWTAFFSGINGSPNVFAHFDTDSDNCVDPENKCLRRIPGFTSTNTEFATTCGVAAAKFKINAVTLNYLQTGKQGGWWQPNHSIVSLAGNVLPEMLDHFWTGQNGNFGWILAHGHEQMPKVFASSYNFNGRWNYCNGVSNTSSKVRLYFR